MSESAFFGRARSAIAERWQSPTHALPVDLFRVLVALLSAVYFIGLLLETRDFSNPDGLIDHTLTREVFWYTKIGLFGPAMTSAQFEAIFALAVLASAGLAAGYRCKLMALFMFIVAVSSYRWNFLVIYVDDGIMHLVLFWMLLLPIGRTLVFSEWLRDGRASMERWKPATVPGAAVRTFLVSLSLVYIVAGAWKWTSPMWREGTALYTALQTPIAWAPDFWKPEHLALVSAADYVTLLLEPLFPLMFLLPANHRLKWALLPALVGFHVGIIATMRVPYANIACLAAIVIIFREEIMQLVWRQRTTGLAVPVGYGGGLCARASLAFVSVLTLAMAGEAAMPSWRAPARAAASDAAAQRAHADRGGFLGTQHNPLYVPLWMVGIAQSYRLFDWIDDRNFRVTYDIVERSRDGTTRAVDPEAIFPSSIRSVLLQTYMHDVTWGSVPRERSDDLKLELYSRFARRFCAASSLTGEIEVSAAVTRLIAPSPRMEGEAETMMRFSCMDHRAELHYASLGGGRSVAAAPLRRVHASLAAGTR